MRVLLTGATGLVGSHIARALIAGGYGVRALVRASSSLENLAGLRLERAEGDVTDRTSLRAALVGCEAVCHTAGVASWSPLDTARIRAVNGAGTRAVLEEALELGVRRAVVTASVVAVGGTAGPVLLDEGAPWALGRLGIPYVDSKRETQEVAFEVGRRGLEVVVLCPGFVLGPGDIYASSASLVLAVVKGRMPAYVEGGVSLVDARDVASGHVAALERGRPGERYILGGENLTMSAFMARIAAQAGVGVPRRVPYAAAWLAAVAADLRSRLTGRAQPFSRNLLRASVLYTFVSSEKAARDLGYSFRPAERSLADTLRYFLANGRLRPSTPELRRLAEAGGA